MFTLKIYLNIRKIWTTYTIRISVFLISILVCLPAHAYQNCLSVAYPRVKEPYRTLIMNIVEGIKSVSKQDVHHIVIKGNSTPEATDCGKLIGLGRGGLSYVEKYYNNRVAAIGAVFKQPGEKTLIPTISMVPDPDVVFTRLKYFMPSVKNISVVYSDSNYGLYISQAEQKAKNHGFTLDAYEASSLGSALSLYSNIFETIDEKNGALWLIQDPAVYNAKNILPVILKEAWRRDIAVFSNHPFHARSGALYSIYPNNKKLGQQLSKIVNDCERNPCNYTSVLGATQVHTAINTRTAKHLGIRIRRGGDPYIDLYFPSYR